MKNPKHNSNNPFHRLLGFIKKTKTSYLSLALSLFHTIITIKLTDPFFEPPTSEITRRNELLTNILLFVTLYVSYYGIIFLLRNYQKYHKYIKIFLLYFIILMLLLILVWPGIWRGPNDEFVIAIDAKRYELYGWHHALTSLLYIISYKLIPIFSGVIIVQCGIISLITSFLYVNLSNQLKLKNRLSKILLIIPFFLPPILDNALYPLRAVLFSYIVVLLIYLMLVTIKTKHLPYINYIILIGSFILASTWRSEGAAFLLFAIFFYIYCLIRKIINPKLSIIALLSIFAGFFLINAFQNTTLDATAKQNYTILGTANTVVPLIRQANQDSTNQDTLSKIDKVIDVDLVVNNPKNTGEQIFFYGGLRDNYSKQDYNDYLMSFIALCLKYPKTVIKNSTVNFLNAISASTVLNDATIYEEYSDQSFIDSIVSEYKQYFSGLVLNNSIDSTDKFGDGYGDNAKEFLAEGGPIMKPINSDLRNTVIKILEGRDLDDYSKFTPLASITWNIIIPFFIIITSIIFLIIKKQFALAFALASILSKTAITFLSAPLSLHMYYYAEYILGYFILFAILAKITNHSKHQHQ